MDFSDFEFLKGYTETEDFPLVICDTAYRIRYMNSVAAEKYKKHGGRNMIGHSLSVFMDEEERSKVEMVVEWFKESKENQQVLAIRDTRRCMDIYLCAIRDENGELIGFCGKQISRKQDENTPYEIID